MLGARRDFEEAVTVYDRKFTDGMPGSTEFENWKKKYRYLLEMKKISYKKIGLDKNYLKTINRFFKLIKQHE